MAIKADLEKDKRVKAEVNRLRKLFEVLPSDALELADGLIIEAAELRIRLEYIREDLDINGYDDMFSQSPNVDPYERERPSARRYVALNKNYQAIMKQLKGYFEKIEGDEIEDELISFLKGKQR